MSLRLHISLYTSIPYIITVLKRYFTLFILFLTVTVLQAQQITVEASVDSTMINIGEQLHLHTVVSCPVGSRVKFPAYADGYLIEGVEVLDAGRIDTVVLNEGKRWELRRDYLLTSFDSALYSLPRFEVEINGNKHLSRNEIGLKVNTVEVDLQHPDEFRPLKAPVDGLFDWSWRIVGWALSGWIALTLAILVAFRLVLARPVTRRVKITPPVPPHIGAFKELEALRAAAFDGYDSEAWYSRLTDSLRDYIAGRYGVNAREMTSYEILRALESVCELQAQIALKEVLEASDLVKFASYQATPIESQAILLRAGRFLEVTKEEIVADAVPQERIIIVSDRTQQRYRLMLKAVLGFAIAYATGSTAYTIYLLWLNFC